MKWQCRTIDPQLREPVWCTQSPFSMTSVWNVFLKKRLASETKHSSPFCEISGLLADYIIDWCIGILTITQLFLLCIIGSSWHSKINLLNPKTGSNKVSRKDAIFEKLIEEEETIICYEETVDKLTIVAIRELKFVGESCNLWTALQHWNHWCLSHKAYHILRNGRLVPRYINLSICILLHFKIVCPLNCVPVGCSIH